MQRHFEHGQLGIECHNRHGPVLMTEAGYYALKEAGAKMTILGFSCPRCHRTLYVTEEVPYGPPTSEMLQEIDETP